MTLKVTILGCGTSGGVPRLAGEWGACDPNNPKNRRRRVSILIESATTRVLVDTSPDLREQLIDANVKTLDAVFWTHDHADHCHGIDDLRGVFQHGGRRIPAYAAPETLAVLKRRFDYIFTPMNGYPALCDAHELSGPVTIGDIEMIPFRQIHGDTFSLGFRFGSAAYSTDLNAIPEEAEPHLKGLDLWIVDALRHAPHPTHPHLEMTLGWIEKYRPKRAVLTHMTWDLDYETLKAELPAGVEPGYDGMVLDLP